MIIIIYNIILFGILQIIKKKMKSTEILQDSKKLPQFLLLAFLYQKILSSVQVIAFFLFFIKLTPFKAWFYLSNFKIIVYHIIYLIVSIIKELYVENSINTRIHSSIITLLMLIDSFKIG